VDEKALSEKNRTDFSNIGETLLQRHPEPYYEASLEELRTMWSSTAIDTWRILASKDDPYQSLNDAYHQFVRKAHQPAKLIAMELAEDLAANQGLYV